MKEVIDSNVWKIFIRFTMATTLILQGIAGWWITNITIKVLQTERTVAVHEVVIGRIDNTMKEISGKMDRLIERRK